MRRAYDGREYLFGSTRIRVLENRMIGREKLERLLTAGSLERCVQLLSEYGVTVYTDPSTGVLLRDQMLSERLNAAYRELLADNPDALFLKLWFYPYDCNNIKAVIKCRRRGVPPDDLLFDCGLIPQDVLLQAVETHDFSALPEHFAVPALEAADALSATGNPQIVDLILDSACYAAMLSAAKASGVEAAVRLVSAKIDLINVTVCLRLLRRAGGASEAGEAMLRDSYLAGGAYSLEELAELYHMGEDALWEKLQRGTLGKFAEGAMASGRSLGEIETAADDHWMRLLQELRMEPYGAEPLMGYLLGSEYEVKNLRILLAGYAAGLSQEQLRERVRLSYV